MKKTISVTLTAFYALLVVVCLASCGGGSSKSKASEILFLTVAAQDLQKTCPVQLGNGITMMNVTYADGKFQYDYAISEENMASIGSDADVKTMVKGMFEGMETEKPLVEALVNTGSDLVYHYYTETGNVRDIVLSPDDLSDIY